MNIPSLSPAIEVLPGTDVPAAWEQFRPFEALHHGMRICNPMTSQELDQLLAVLAPRDGERVLDIACGHGELLIRMAETAAVAGTGIDLSPWVLVRAVASAAERGVAGRLRWILGNGAGLPAEPIHDIVTCLGASWIWDGFAGTARALRDRVAPGGRIAIGDVQERPDAAAGDLQSLEETALTRDAQMAVLYEHGFDPIAEFRFPVSSWEAYNDRVRESAAAYAAGHEGDPRYDYRAMAADWDGAAYLRTFAWTVWFAAVR